MSRTDRRVARTRRLLRQAQIALVIERGWDRVTVQDICERADVGRSTFYVHFADKEELLLSGFEVFEHELREQVQRAGGKPLAFVGLLLAHVLEHEHLSQVLVGTPSDQAVKYRLLDVIRSLLKDDLARIALPETIRTVAVHYIAGAFLEVLVWWLDSRPRLEPREVEKLLLQLTAPILDSSLRR